MPATNLTSTTNTGTAAGAMVQEELQQAQVRVAQVATQQEVAAQFKFSTIELERGVSSMATRTSATTATNLAPMWACNSFQRCQKAVDAGFFVGRRHTCRTQYNEMPRCCAMAASLPSSTFAKPSTSSRWRCRATRSGRIR